MSEPSDAERPVPPVPAGQTAPGEHEVALDLAAFLPDDVELAGPDDAADAEAVSTTVPDTDPWDTGAPEPEVPAWALDDTPAAATSPAPVPAPPAPIEATPEPAHVPVEPPADPSATAALDRIDAELAAVDDALVALDAGTPEASPLLRDLLA